MLGQGHRADRAEIPQRRPRYSRETKAVVRANYFGKMAVVSGEAGMVAASSEQVRRRRMLRIMSKRQEEYERGRDPQYTTHLWTQHHLRQAGVNLPEVQWPSKGKEGEGKGQEGKGTCKGKAPPASGPKGSRQWQGASRQWQGAASSSSSSQPWWRGLGSKGGGGWWGSWQW